MDNRLYYRPDKLLSYNRILNFVVGARGIGKTYSLKKYMINRFIKYHEQFIYLKRTKMQVKPIKMKRFFDAVAKEFPKHKFEVKGQIFYIDDQIAGYAKSLSTWQNDKSDEYPFVTTICFDEFMLEKGTTHYLPNEPKMLLNFMDTVIRTRDNARVICLSNAVSINNPYFVYFKAIPDTTKRYNAYKDIVIEIPDSLDFAEERKKTKFGSLISETDYGDFALKNEFVNDSNVFVEKRSKESTFEFNIVFNGMTLGLWTDKNKGCMYLSNDHDPTSKRTFALSSNDMKENVMLMTTWRDNYYLSTMVKAFKKGFLRFDNTMLRSIGYDIFNKMHI